MLNYQARAEREGSRVGYSWQVLLQCEWWAIPEKENRGSGEWGHTFSFLFFCFAPGNSRKKQSSTPGTFTFFLGHPALQNTIQLEIQDSKFKIEKENYENAFQEKRPGFRISKYMSQYSYYKALISFKLLLFHTKVCALLWLAINLIE